MTRKEILDVAQEITHHNRQDDYGKPENNFGTIAVMVSEYLSAKFGVKIVLDPHDIAVINVLQKVSRIAITPAKADSWIDLAGYGACGGECATTKTP